MYTAEKISSNNKKDFYELLLAQLEALISDEEDFIANLANASALLYDQMEGINWAGFYLYKENQLVLGPFQGKPACVRIQIGKGVCGTAAQSKEVIVVEDVHEFPGHIACDAATNSEIVLPILKNGELFGVLDIDSPVKNRFDEIDQEYLQGFLDIIGKHSKY